MLAQNNPGLPKDSNKEPYSFAAEPRGMEPRKKSRDPNVDDQKAPGYD
jgi:hypothetical protein